MKDLRQMMRASSEVKAPKRPLEVKRFYDRASLKRALYRETMSL